jgi:pyrimidine-specific ribonucleoside hydrolase
MADLGWQRSERHPEDRHAVELLRALLREAASGDPANRVTLVPLAPLTNIALLLRTYPEAATGLREIVFMGGAAHVGNATASAEFNVWHDPEAAAIVLQSAAELDIPVVMYGLDVFYDVTVTRAQAARLIAVGGRGPAELAGRIDRGAVTTERLPVRVELAGTHSRGRTIVDRREGAGDVDRDPQGIPPTSVDVALSVDGGRYADLWLRTVNVAAR